MTKTYELPNEKMIMADVDEKHHTATVSVYALDDLVEAVNKTGHCKDCKWWKDNGGVFRRGIGAESQCPINSIEVYEGNGYCYMFEPQERSDKE